MKFTMFFGEIIPIAGSLFFHIIPFSLATAFGLSSAILGQALAYVSKKFLAKHILNRRLDEDIVKIISQRKAYLENKIKLDKEIELNLWTTHAISVKKTHQKEMIVF